jgi:hypothetical protein
MVMPKARVYAVVRPLLVGVGCRPVLLAAAALPLGIAWGLGAGYGAPSLFWHSDTLVQALGGLGVTLLLGQVCFVAYLLDSGRQRGRPNGAGSLAAGPAPPADSSARRSYRMLAAIMRRVRTLLIAAMHPIVPGAGPRRPEPPSWQRLRSYLAVTWLPLLVLLVLPAIGYFTTDWPWTGDDSDYYTDDQRFGRHYWSEEGLGVAGLGADWCFVIALPKRWPLLTGIIAALVLSRGFVELFLWLSPRLTPWLARTLPARVAALPAQPVVHLVLGLVFAGLFWLTWSASTADQCLLLALWVATHAGVVALYGVADDAGSADLWKHVLAGMAFGGFTLLYEALFALYRLSGGAWPADYISPVLVLCLLLALAVTVHGFLRFHFRIGYGVVGSGLLVTVVVLGSLAGYQHEVLGLERAALKGAPVSLKDADGPALVSAYHDARATVRRLTDRAKTAPDAVTAAEITQAESEVSERATALRAFYRRFLDRYTGQIAPFDGGGGAAGALPPNPSDAALSADIKALRDRLLALERHRLQVWRKQASPQGRRPRIAVVAVSGGASRAALWTTVVLDKLDTELPSFSRRLRVIAGASGGMVGASHYAATLPGPAGHDANRDRQAFVRAIAEDSLTPVMQRLLFIDVPAAILPRAADTDRGRALEEAWCKHSPALRSTFAELAAGEAEGWRPSLIFSPMLIEDGRRLLISNLYLPQLTESSGSLLSETRDVRPAVRDFANRAKAGAQRTLPKAKRSDSRHGEQFDDRTRYSLSAVELFSLFPQARSQLAVSTAARMSATFPYISPPGDMPVEPRRRAVDAGYYDNYGVAVAAAWISHNRAWLAQHTSGVVLIQVRDQASRRRQLYTEDEQDRWSLARGVEWLTGPLAGASSAFESIMAFRNDERVQELDDYFSAAKGDRFFTTVVFESRAEISLNWYLNEAEKAHVLKGFDAYRDPTGAEVPSANGLALDSLRRWWGPGHD